MTLSCFIYFDRETCVPKADEKLKDELKDFIRKRNFYDFYDFPSFQTPDLAMTDLMRRLAITDLMKRLAESLGEKKNPNTEETISPILPFPRLG